MSNAMSQTDFSNTRLWMTVLAAFVVALLVMVACAYAWVFIYSVFVHNTGDAAYYEAYAQVASPVVAVAVSGPVFYMVGRFMQRFGQKALYAAMMVVLVNTCVDALVLTTLSEHVAHHVLMSTFAVAGKLFGAWTGAVAGK